MVLVSLVLNNYEPRTPLQIEFFANENIIFVYKNEFICMLIAFSSCFIIILVTKQVTIRVPWHIQCTIQMHLTFFHEIIILLKVTVTRLLFGDKYNVALEIETINFISGSFVYLLIGILRWTFVEKVDFILDSLISLADYLLNQWSQLNRNAFSFLHVLFYFLKTHSLCVTV